MKKKQFFEKILGKRFADTRKTPTFATAFENERHQKEKSFGV